MQVGHTRPTANVLPDGATHETLRTLHLSAAVGLAQSTSAPPGDVGLTATFAGHMIMGAVVSTTMSVSDPTESATVNVSAPFVPAEAAIGVGDAVSLNVTPAACQERVTGSPASEIDACSSVSRNVLE